MHEISRSASVALLCGTLCSLWLICVAYTSKLRRQIKNFEPQKALRHTEKNSQRNYPELLKFRD
jgi:hypothetical protein